MSHNLRSGGLFVVAFIGFGAFQAVTGILDVDFGGGDASPAAAAQSVAVKPGTVPSKYRSLVNAWGNSCPEISPALLSAQLSQESGWNPRARSGVGAMGIAQFMPGTWSGNGIDGDKDGDRDVWDPQDAIPSAAVYDCKLAKRVRRVGGDTTTNMLAAYNAGTGAVFKYGGVPPYQQTRNYVAVIQAAEKRYQ